ncbi:hypothetical protein F5887DRAFT_913084 [Amanita rubescens]|nr:hypothetical protein F5887DRAFT_913084 [Amanita rubescens]
MASRCTGVFRSLSRPSNFSRSSRPSLRWLATATEQASQSAAPQPPAIPSDPQISRIVDDISGLTLLQAADLVSLLKSRLNIQEIAMPAAAAPAAPAAAEAEAPAEKPKERTSFNVKLESFDAAAKAKAKKFVESLPQILKENMPKEEAEKLKATLEGHGAVVKLE